MSLEGFECDFIACRGLDLLSLSLQKALVAAWLCCLGLLFLGYF